MFNAEPKGCVIDEHLCSVNWGFYYLNFVITDEILKNGKTRCNLNRVATKYENIILLKIL